MSKTRVFLVIVVFALAAILGSPSFAQSNEAVAKEVIALAKAEWAAFDKKNVAEATKNWADEYTQFGPGFSTRVEGKDLLVRMQEANATGSGSGIFSDMANPKVQVYGDVAILSYNYMGINKDKDGGLENSRAKSTRVYVKKGGGWMLVHANFGADPLPD